MFSTAANFVLALLEDRPISARRILRDAGTPKDLDIQGLQKRLDEAVERKELEAQFALSNGILIESLRIEFKPLDCESLARFIGAPEEPQVDEAILTRMAEEAFELGRRSVESIVELHATQFSSLLDEMEEPKFLEVNAI